jgi:hypothetical protein
VTSTTLEGLQPGDHVTASIDVQMGGEPMYGPPYSEVRIGLYPICYCRKTATKYVSKSGRKWSSCTAK